MSAHATATIVMMEATDTTVRAASSDGDVAGRSPDRGVGRLHHHDRGGGVGAVTSQAVTRAVADDAPGLAHAADSVSDDRNVRARNGIRRRSPLCAALV